MAKTGPKLTVRDLRADNIGSWPILFQALVFLLAMAVGAAAVYYFAVRPVIEERETVENKISKVNKEIATLESKVRLFKEQEKKVEVLMASLEEKNKILPKRQEQPELIDAVAENALAADLSVLQFKPQEEVQRELFYELPIELKIKGDYHSIGDFMAKVSSMERLVVPSQLEIRNIAPDDVSGELSGDLIFKTYRFRELPLEVESAVVNN